MKKIVGKVLMMVCLLISIIFSTTVQATVDMYTMPEQISVKAEVIEAGEPYVEETENPYAENVGQYKIKYQDIKVKITEGDFKGEELTAKYNVSYDPQGKIEGYPLDKGNIIGISITLTEDGTAIDLAQEVVVNDIVRSGYLILMVLLFFLVVILVGRKQGLKAILAFVITILTIFVFMLPQILDGKNAVIMSILTCVIVIILTFIIISGFTRKSFAAVIGTCGGVISAGIMASIFGIMAKLSGAQEEAMFIVVNAQDIALNFKDLLFAGIVISALGAAMDVGMSIASSLEEIKEQNPNISKGELFKSGMNIGGDVIGTMTNTLILAYVGGAITLVLLFMIRGLPILEILNIEMIATDVVSALAASMGVIFTVPITAVASTLMHDRRTYNKTSNNIVDKKRTLDI